MSNPTLWTKFNTRPPFCSNTMVCFLFPSCLCERGKTKHAALTLEIPAQIHAGTESQQNWGANCGVTNIWSPSLLNRSYITFNFSSVYQAWVDILPSCPLCIPGECCRTRAGPQTASRPCNSWGRCAWHYPHPQWGSETANSKETGGWTKTSTGINAITLLKAKKYSDRNGCFTTEWCNWYWGTMP